MTFAPPVSRGSFHYNGTLYVDVGNFNRHERATVEEVTAYLRPDLKKSKKVSVDQSKDQVGHWYEAQLIHYGLPPSKDKARAKMRLLEALNQSKLTVPSNIINMEAEMKKEYAAAERKAKAQYKASMVPAVKSESPVAGKNESSLSLREMLTISMSILVWEMIFLDSQAVLMLPVTRHQPRKLRLHRQSQPKRRLRKLPLRSHRRRLLRQRSKSHRHKRLTDQNRPRNAQDSLRLG